MNPEPIAPAAPILVHSLDEEEDGYAQQQEVKDRINIDICTTKHKSGTGLRVEKSTCSTVKYSHRSEKSSDAGSDRITIDFRTDIRPPHQQQREPELGLGEATVRSPAVPPQQDSFHTQQDFQSAAGITLAELEKDLRYQCVKAQPDPWESQDQCSVSCAKWYIYLLRLYSCHTCTRNILRCQCGRFEGLVLNNRLQHAFVVGWAMFMSSVFPLKPNWIWDYFQLAFFLSFGLISASLLAFSSCFKAINIALLVLVIVLACCDVFVTLFLRCCQQRNQQPPEAESLLHPNRQTRSRFKDWLYRYNYLLKLVATEIVTYLILLSTIVYSGHSTCTELPSTFTLIWSAATFLILVYASQLVFFARFTVTLWKYLKPLPATRRRAWWLLFRFSLHFVSYRIFQTVLLVMLYLSVVSENDTVPIHNWVIWTTGILTYLTPIVGILAFLIVKHGWILDLCIVYCTDYLSYLNTIQSNPNTGQETKQSIQAALTKFGFETLVQESQEYQKGNRCAVNSVYLFNPLMLLLSLPIMICMGALSYISYYGFFINFVSIVSVVVFFTFVNHIHLILVYLAWPVLVLGMLMYAMVYFAWIHITV